jgi:hypothetical protein
MVLRSQDFIVMLFRIFQFLPPKNRLDLLLLLEWGDFNAVNKSHIWDPHNKEDTKRAEAEDISFSSNPYDDLRPEMPTHISKRKTAIINIERKRRSVQQVRNMIDELSNSPKSLSPSTPPSTGWKEGTPTEVEMKKEEQAQEEIEARVLKDLVETIETAVKHLYNQLDCIL